MSYLFNTFLYQPLYNGLIFLMDLLPWADPGVAVILFTIIVKLALFPLSQKATKTTLEMKEFEGELNTLKEKHKNNRDEQARAIMAFYKEKNINPFSGLLLLFIQIPIVIALYYVFYKGGLPAVKQELLYPFVFVPAVNMEFLGLIDIAKKSLLLAFIAGITQYFQLKFSVPIAKASEKPSLKEDLARNMSIQMRFIMPVITFIIAYTVSGAIALYFTTSNLFAIGQELYIRKTLKIARARASNLNAR